MNQQNLNKNRLQAPKRILVVRTDRLGDVILSLPVPIALKKSYPGVQISMLVQPYTAKIAAGHPAVDELLIYDNLPEKNKLRFIRQWARRLRQKQFDAVLVLHASFELALICYWAGIPVRVGTGFRAYAFLFNRKVFHHRKNAERHELDYNLDLVKKIGAEPGTVRFQIDIPEQAFVTAKNFLIQNKLTSQQKPVILHPGSGGSAKDWPLQKFAQLNDQLQKELGVKVIITGGPTEQDIIKNLISRCRHKPVGWSGSHSLKELAALIQQAGLFISNSTGPLHLAVAVETPVIGFYCPIIPCLPQRWGPYAQVDSVLMPPGVPHCKKCTFERCQYFNCMERIEVSQAMEMAGKKLGVQN